MLLAVLIYGAFVFISGYRELGSRLANFAWLAFVAACALAFTNYLLRFLKWEYYLRLLEIRGIGKFDSLCIFLSGFVLTVTPGKVGEVFKSLLLNETHKVPIARTAPIVVAERLTDLIGIIGLITIGSLGFRGGLVWAALGALVVGSIMIVIMSPRLFEKALKLLERIPGPGKRMAPKIRESWQSLRVLTTPRALILPTVLSVGAWSLEGFALWVILKGFAAQIAAAPAMFFYSVATLAGALIPVPGGLGVTEGSLKGQLQAIGAVDGSTSTASMLLVRFATLWFAVVVGFVALSILRLRHPNLQSTPEVTPSSAPVDVPGQTSAAE
jgi:uncharacterized protein (TIRG00374 family)